MSVHHAEHAGRHDKKTTFKNRGSGVGEHCCLTVAVFVMIALVVCCRATVHSGGGGAIDSCGEPAQPGGSASAGPVRVPDAQSGPGLCAGRQLRRAQLPPRRRLGLHRQHGAPQAHQTWTGLCRSLEGDMETCVRDWQSTTSSNAQLSTGAQMFQSCLQALHCRRESVISALVCDVARLGNGSYRTVGL